MNKRQFLCFVCTLLLGLVCFCLFMQSGPSTSWAIVAMIAFLIVLGIIVYYFLNWSIKAWLE
ncbi:hypothetical protein [Dictyobacter aurantiacus]|uniref:Uncharacterized protein n=1 Tax=Dictyobacter aurantiacus TaxID=1936993 RepID=A0A401ZFD1_9CHLR|nr:hypothetical protein [Dictyobacter aurantiacus]GCE05601.1 hypothetical protein KDAU_29300 [Dictyobacter aurantiacus]